MFTYVQMLRLYFLGADCKNGHMSKIIFPYVNKVLSLSLSLCLFLSLSLSLSLSL